MSGSYHQYAGYIKTKLGELTDDSALKDSGRDQQLLGKLHRFVGTLRSVREATTADFNRKRLESQAICRKHGGRLLDVASDFVEDMKKALLK
ncbi:MAG: CsbD family protein [Bdellovibrionota bacterium]